MEQFKDVFSSIIIFFSSKFSEKSSTCFYKKENINRILKTFHKKINDINELGNSVHHKSKFFLLEDIENNALISFIDEIFMKATDSEKDKIHEVSTDTEEPIEKITFEINFFFRL